MHFSAWEPGGQTWILTGGARVPWLFKGRVPFGNADFVPAAPDTCCGCCYSSTGACFSTGKIIVLGGGQARHPRPPGAPLISDLGDSCDFWGQVLC